MKIKLKGYGSDNLIVFFSGFSIGPSVFEKLESEKNDILYIYDYESIDEDFDISGYTKNYHNLYLISYSFGVYIAATLEGVRKVNFKRSIAVNGTLKPVSDFFGIPEAIFKGTLDKLDDEHLMKFYKRVFGSHYNEVSEILHFDGNKGKRELAAINVYLKSSRLVENIYDVAIIAEKDKIFPPENQINFWQNEVEKIIIKGEHFPFYSFTDFGEILSVS
ncbi:MAG: DUF452 family protein [Deferribacterales bacterium]